MPCPQCGAELPGDGSDYVDCPACGWIVARAEDPEPPPAPAALLACPRCGSSQEADASFCDQCASPLVGAGPAAPRTPEPAVSDVPCPECGGPVVELAPDAGVCRLCGARLSAVEDRKLKWLGLAAGALAAALAFVLWRRH